MTFHIDPDNEELWSKYAPENFPVMTWKSTPRDRNGKDTGSVYVFPRTADGLIKIGYRGIKVRMTLHRACRKTSGWYRVRIEHNYLTYLSSSPILCPRLKKRLSRRMGSGQSRSLRANQRIFPNQLWTRSGSLCQSSCPISLILRFTRINFAGIPTPWIIHFLSVILSARVFMELFKFKH